jgi:hypothetical protein
MGLDGAVVSVAVEIQTVMVGRDCHVVRLINRCREGVQGIGTTHGAMGLSSMGMQQMKERMLISVWQIKTTRSASA